MANLATASIKALNHPTTRTLAAHLGEIVNVKGFGATGNGSTNDAPAIQAALNYAFATPAVSRAAVFFPAGDYRVDTALTLTDVRGAHIFGAGRFATKIFNPNVNGSVFVTNGFDYSVVENMRLVCTDAGTGICFDLDFDGTGPTNIQSNTFFNIYFEEGAYGLSIGKTGFMGSENTISNCYFAGNSVAGIATRNANALQQSVIGGNFSTCGIGIWVSTGSAPVITGVGFQNQVTANIKVDNSSKDTYVISACRSETGYAGAPPGPTFFHFANGPGAVISGCTCTAPVANPFAFCEAGEIGAYTFNDCFSENGTFTGNGIVQLNGGVYKNAAYLTAGNFTQLDVWPLVITTKTAGAYTFVPGDGSTKVRFNSASAQTATVNSIANGFNLRTGSRITVQRVGAGLVTIVAGSGVTINSSNGLKLRAQYSEATLECDAPDTWTLTGDTLI